MKQRGHFALFVPRLSDVELFPSKAQTCGGQIIHVVGNPLNGFVHEFKQDYDSLSLSRVTFLGYLLEPPNGDYNLSAPDSVENALKAAALQVPTPPRSDPRAPVDGVSAPAD